MAVLHEASALRVGLLASRAYAPGELLTLVPSPPHPLAGRTFSFRVTQCLPASGGGYEVAGLFADPISDAEARALSS